MVATVRFILPIVMSLVFLVSPSKLQNCEDNMMKAPCYTFDEGKWRIVLSYHPYKSIVYPKQKTWH